ncbi:hypothetical protein GCM10010324_18070 [Streptomyces hiroshimensis]|uniref:Uncharacterized protein n=1 Tax=Streptomyces hiroshimensis TaxID=66424 RepID=A0ABQ2Y8T9_9ACTN|nr:hypothetical protein GCM10010324_18070 [Streptomyces hiroshimensis]
MAEPAPRAAVRAVRLTHAERLTDIAALPPGALLDKLSAPPVPPSPPDIHSSDSATPDTPASGHRALRQLLSLTHAEAPDRQAGQVGPDLIVYYMIRAGQAPLATSESSIE